MLSVAGKQGSSIAHLIASETSGEWRIASSPFKRKKTHRLLLDCRHELSATSLYKSKGGLRARPPMYVKSTMSFPRKQR